MCQSAVTKFTSYYTVTLNRTLSATCHADTPSHWPFFILIVRLLSGITKKGNMNKLITSINIALIASHSFVILPCVGEIFNGETTARRVTERMRGDVGCSHLFLRTRFRPYYTHCCGWCLHTHSQCYLVCFSAYNTEWMLFRLLP